MKQTTKKHAESTLVGFRESLGYVLFISTDIRVVKTFATCYYYASTLILGRIEAGSEGQVVMLKRVSSWGRPTTLRPQG